MPDWVLPAATLIGAVLITFSCCVRPMRKGRGSVAAEDAIASMDEQLGRLQMELGCLEARQRSAASTRVVAERPSPAAVATEPSVGSAMVLRGST